jgi:hypothetical protein
MAEGFNREFAYPLPFGSAGSKPVSAVQQHKHSLQPRQI